MSLHQVCGEQPRDAKPNWVTIVSQFVPSLWAFGNGFLHSFLVERVGKPDMGARATKSQIWPWFKTNGAILQGQPPVQVPA